MTIKPTIQHFITVLLHSLIYHKQLYPNRAFSFVRAYDLAVPQARHPDVIAWLEQVSASVCNIIFSSSSSISALSLIIFQDSKLVEKIKITLNVFPLLDDNDNINFAQEDLSHVKSQFRSCLMDVSSALSSSSNTPFENTSSFTISIETPQDSQPLDDNNWISSSSTVTHYSNLSTSVVTPISIVDLGPISFNICSISL